MILTVNFPIFCQYYDRHDFKAATIFFCDILEVLTEHMFENLMSFISTNFKIINEKRLFFVRM